MTFVKYACGCVNCGPKCECLGECSDRCQKCGSERIKRTASGRRYCVPCRLAHEKRRKRRKRDLNPNDAKGI